jgi:hypothetical protein
MIIIDAAATRQALPFDRLVAALRAQFAEGCEVPVRHVHEIASPGATPITSLIMPAWQPGRYYGVKVVNIAPGNAARGLPGLHASYLLHDATTGAPLALIDGDEITARRTVAAPALAASYLGLHWPRRTWHVVMRGTCWSSAQGAWRSCCRKPIARCVASSASASGRAMRSRPGDWPLNGERRASKQTR